jgi:hypothetical protein
MVCRPDAFGLPVRPGCRLVRRDDAGHAEAVRQREDRYEGRGLKTRIRAEAAAPSLGITAVLARAAFGFFRGLGWIVAGFARDERSAVFAPNMPAGRAATP